jgi:hypothetical protein
MDQFWKKTINQEGKKKEAEEDLVRTSWEENTGDGAAKSHRPFHYIFRSSVTNLPFFSPSHFA